MTFTSSAFSWQGTFASADFSTLEHLFGHGDSFRDGFEVMISHIQEYVTFVPEKTVVNKKNEIVGWNFSSEDGRYKICIVND